LKNSDPGPALNFSRFHFAREERLWMFPLYLGWQKKHAHWTLLHRAMRLGLKGGNRTRLLRRQWSLRVR
jgi:hypothetical protein